MQEYISNEKAYKALMSETPEGSREPAGPGSAKDGEPKAGGPKGGIRKFV